MEPKILAQLEQLIAQGNVVIPKLRSRRTYKIDGFSTRNGEPAISVTNLANKPSEKNHTKRITTNEFLAAYNHLIETENFSKDWFVKNLPDCHKQGDCNFTSIGGIFILLGIARYDENRRYVTI